MRSVIKDDIIYQQLEILEKFLAENTESDIKEAANYLYDRVMINLDKLKNTKDEHLTLRFKVIQNQLIKYLESPKSEKKIIFIMNSTEMAFSKTAGLADKLRGVVSVYKIAKELGIDFFLLWDYPVDIKNYLIPNTYNWMIKEEDIIIYKLENSFTVNPNKSIFYNFSTYFGKFDIESLKDNFKYLLQKWDQIHTFTNQIYFTNEEFGGLFNELFKPTNELQANINHHLSQMDNQFISATFRFRSLLGDFVEGVDLSLPVIEQEKLIDRCIKHLINLHESNIEKQILVTSDSIRFLEKIKNYDFVYVIPGTVVAHYGHNPGHSVDVYMKSFLDFFLLTYSKCIYLIVDGKMYESGFPKIAALIHNTPLKIIYNR